MRRVWAELRAQGLRVSRRRVWRLMRAAGLQGRHPRAWRATTIPGRRPIDAPDLLGGDFTARETATAWCGDITYITTVDGWANLATVIDLASRTVVGWAIDEHLRTSLVTDALGQALATRRPDPGVPWRFWSSRHGRRHRWRRCGYWPGDRSGARPGRDGHLRRRGRADLYPSESAAGSDGLRQLGVDPAQAQTGGTHDAMIVGAALLTAAALGAVVTLPRPGTEGPEAQSPESLHRSRTGEQSSRALRSSARCSLLMSGGFAWPVYLLARQMSRFASAATEHHPKRHQVKLTPGGEGHRNS